LISFSLPVSACASKLKGRTGKWLRQELGLAKPEDLLSKGYFACTTGKSDRASVERYLRNWAEANAKTET
jgi:hypothetical protein